MESPVMMLLSTIGSRRSNDPWQCETPFRLTTVRTRLYHKLAELHALDYLSRVTIIYLDEEVALA